MNILSRLLHRLFPRDGQLRIAVYYDGRVQIQEYCEYSGTWRTYQYRKASLYCDYSGTWRTYQYRKASFNSFDEAKQAYDVIMEDRNRLDKMHSIVSTYP